MHGVEELNNNSMWLFLDICVICVALIVNKILTIHYQNKKEQK